LAISLAYNFSSASPRAVARMMMREALRGNRIAA
jgi:hypothetical protein